MISRNDLDKAIAECLEVKNPDVNTCIKLSAFYNIKDHLYPDDFNPPAIQEPVDRSEFLQVADGRPDVVLPIMDELMNILSMVYPRLYDEVMRRLV